MFKKGQSGNPAGNVKGVQHKTTRRIKEKYCDLLDNNSQNIQRWLDQVAAEDPAKALDFLIKLSPFVLPKKSEDAITLEQPIKIILPENT